MPTPQRHAATLLTARVQQFSTAGQHKSSILDRKGLFFVDDSFAQWMPKLRVRRSVPGDRALPGHGVRVHATFL